MKKSLKEIQADIRRDVQNISIKPRGTVEGEVQREAFRIRWGKKPDQL
jgi:hypothetical protein